MIGLEYKLIEGCVNILCDIRDMHAYQPQHSSHIYIRVFTQYNHFKLTQLNARLAVNQLVIYRLNTF